MGTNNQLFILRRIVSAVSVYKKLYLETIIVASIIIKIEWIKKSSHFQE